MEIGTEILWAIVRLLMNPLTYIFLIVSWWAAAAVVKRQRRDFHTRVHSIGDQLISPAAVSFIAAAAVTAVILLIGVELPAGVLMLLGAVWLPLLLTRNGRWMSFTVAGPLTLLILPWLPAGGTDWPLVNQRLAEISEWNVYNFVILLAVMALAEAVLIRKDGAAQTSPTVVRSPRGKMVGEHRARRIWLLPVVFLFPAGAVSGSAYWPLLPELAVTGGLGFIAVPFLLGLQLRIHSDMPADGVRKVGFRLTLLALLTAGAAAGAYWYEPLIWAVPALMLLGRAGIFFVYQAGDQKRISQFPRLEQGMKVLGVLPDTTAEKLEILTGEIITKVNGREVLSQREFYDALQQNPAFCKLEIKDRNGEPRIAQASVYEKDHYQIGCLFVPDDEYGNLSSRALRSSAVIQSDRADIARERSEEDSAAFHKEETAAGVDEDITAETPENKADSQAVNDDSGDNVHERFAESSAEEENPEEEERTDAEEEPEPLLEQQDDLPDEASGQASGLSAFYDEFRDTRPKRDYQRPIDSDEDYDKNV
ncbi:PDZ domain-containing protein [Salisediminibacterium halotolerans]|uniref:PDZ domain-containing protein n=1 Tax=Salisediminibacterium halotolerans TaxID=517425 RepID=A0A1H9W1E3_9BACI|nr:PDZ domain-containing protein [Salisediminibacterium haloalkalitolerans]SES27746.1 hypothetical protein SAMN05444126_12628 [Salisediminibacterium haloalkalitolerans]